jgi:hypothetical protein
MGSTSPEPPITPLMLCPTCALEMRLFGIEPENAKRDLFTFECGGCGRLEVRGVLVASASPAASR